MRWCRLYTETPSDPKLRRIAHTAGATLAHTLAVWTSMLCHAAGQEGEAWGTLTGWDDMDCAVNLGLDGPIVYAIRREMEGRIIEGNRIIKWDLRQAKTDHSAERMRNWRARKTEQSQALKSDVTSRSVTVTQSDGKKRIEEKRSDTNVSPSPPKRGDVPARQDEAFERFWQHYPRKVGKGAARKAWPIALKRAEEGADSILAGLITQTSLSRFDLREGMRFCPHAATWLNREGWLDGLADEEPEQARRSA